MRKIVMTLAVIALLLSACSEDLLCKGPYKRIDDVCCLDRDNNNMCDFDEIRNRTENISEEIKGNTDNLIDSIDEDFINRNLLLDSLDKMQLALLGDGPAGVEISEFNISEEGYDEMLLGNVTVRVIIIERNITPTMEIYLFEKQKVDLDTAPMSFRSIPSLGPGREVEIEVEVGSFVKELETPRVIVAVLKDESGQTLAIDEEEVVFADLAEEFAFRTLNSCERLTNEEEKYKCRGIVGGRSENKDVCEAEELTNTRSKRMLRNRAYCITGYVLETGNWEYCSQIDYNYGEDLIKIYGECLKRIN